MSVDLGNRKLTDGLTKLNRFASVINSVESTISSVQRNNPFRELLEQYAVITKPTNYKSSSIGNET